MEPHGFIHGMLDVKVLILFVTSKALYPMDVQKAYELCFQDDRLSYFDVSVAVPELAQSGHLEEVEPGQYVITEKGREHEQIMHDTIAFPVMQRALAAVERFNREVRRDNLIRTEIIPKEDGAFSIVMALDDDRSNLMTLELYAPNQQQAKRMVRLFRKRAESVYNVVINTLMEPQEKDL